MNSITIHEHELIDHPAPLRSAAMLIAHNKGMPTVGQILIELDPAYSYVRTYHPHNRTIEIKWQS